MKKNVKDFIFRGFFAGGFGPLVLAVLYLILQKNNLVQTLTVNEMSKGIFSLYILAFIAGGMNVIYQILPGSGRQEYLEAVVNNILFFG